MSRRVLISAVAAVLAVTTLAGCRTNVGVAARVDGTRITESDVNQYLSSAGVDKAALAAQGQQAGSPRTLVLQYLILGQVFAKTLQRQHVSVSAGELAALHDDAGSNLVGQQLTGSAIESRLDKGLLQRGVKRNFTAQLLRTRELFELLIAKGKIRTNGQFLSAIKPVASRVSVSPRYGSWNASSLQLSEQPVLPSFVSLQPSGS